MVASGLGSPDHNAVGLALAATGMGTALPAPNAPHCFVPDVVTAHSTLVVALKATNAVVAAAREHKHVAALAREHERTAVDTLAKQLAEAKHHLLGSPCLDPLSKLPMVDPRFDVQPCNHRQPPHQGDGC